MKLRTIWNDILNLFYPDLCVLCKTPLVKGERHVCLCCLCDLPRVSTYSYSIQSPVEHLLLPPENRGYIFSFLVYEKGGGVQLLVHQLKYYDNTGLAWQLGRQAALELLLKKECLNEVDVLLPVPLHWMRKWKRGYNQSEWIARGIQSVLGKAIDTNSLKRVRHVNTQTRKSVYDRWLNVDDIFKYNEKGSLSGKHVLLIDDVMTTGATLGSCIKVLSEIPDIKISVFALASV